MTIITVTAPLGRFTSDQRSKLATTLTDAVLVPEVGQHAPAARVGFQVHFVDLPLDGMAIGGILLSEKMRDIMVIDIAVMDGDWRKEVRAEVIRRIFTALTEASGLPAPSPTWWVNFRVIDEGSWGSRGDVLSIFDLLGSGVFTPEKIDAIHAALKG